MLQALGLISPAAAPPPHPPPPQIKPTQRDVNLHSVIKKSGGSMIRQGDEGTGISGRNVRHHVLLR